MKSRRSKSCSVPVRQPRRIIMAFLSEDSSVVLRKLTRADHRPHEVAQRVLAVGILIEQFHKLRALVGCWCTRKGGQVQFFHHFAAGRSLGEPSVNTSVFLEELVVVSCAGEDV